MGEIYALGWIGIFVLSVPLSIMFAFKELGNQAPYWGVLEILLMYASLYGLLRWSMKIEERKSVN